MDINFQTIDLIKRFPLRISRGEVARSSNLIVTINNGKQIGIGESAPGKNEGAATVEACQEQLQEWLGKIGRPSEHPQVAYSQAMEMGVSPCAYAGFDIALWDLLAKSADLPLHRLLGLGKPRVASSVTLGIVKPELVAERLPAILASSGSRFLKVKLGCNEGIETDQEMFTAVLSCIGNQQIQIRVDANGGWSLSEARLMSKWLGQRGIDYLEQPLAVVDDNRLNNLSSEGTLPIFVDESCRFAKDVPRFAKTVAGVNLKLMKCGGITEALRIVAVARAHGLNTMIGCMGESSISIAAAAAISSLFDHIDLDSHLNLSPDPAHGVENHLGIITPSCRPGHGGALRC